MGRHETYETGWRSDTYFEVSGHGVKPSKSLTEHDRHESTVDEHMAHCSSSDRRKSTTTQLAEIFGAAPDF